MGALRFIKVYIHFITMIPPDGSIIRFTKGFYTDREYLVVSNGQLRSWDEKLEIIFWEFFTDGERLGPLGEAKWDPTCEQLRVVWEIIGRIESWTPVPV
jgi:hypothetical protein